MLAESREKIVQGYQWSRDHARQLSILSFGGGTPCSNIFKYLG